MFLFYTFYFKKPNWPFVEINSFRLDFTGCGQKGAREG